VKKEFGRFVCASDVVISTTGVPSEAIRQYHRQLLKRALDALDFQPVQERDITGISFSCDTKDIEAIRREISEFQDRMIAKYHRSRGNEVYHLETALFRLTEGVTHEN
jgi:uncharacterized protein (TIGR02147 family)